MSTFNAGCDNNFLAPPSNVSRNKTFNFNKTIDSNRTFDVVPSNKTFNSSSLNRTFPSQSPHKTFVATSPNKTFAARSPGRTFTARSPGKTFTAAGPSRQNKTFAMDIPTNKTFNAQSASKTFTSATSQPSSNGRTFNVENKTFDVTNQSSRQDQIGPDPLLISYTPYEQSLLSRLEIVCTEIRSFIMSMYKFFCNNHSCNWGTVYTIIGEIDLTTQSMINEIFLQQMRIDDQREATEYPSDFDSSDYAVNSSNGKSIIDDIRRRVDHLNVSSRSADSLIEGLMNIQQAETNLRKFGAFEDLRDL